MNSYLMDEGVLITVFFTGVIVMTSFFRGVLSSKLSRDHRVVELPESRRMEDIGGFPQSVSRYEV